MLHVNIEQLIIGLPTSSYAVYYQLVSRNHRYYFENKVKWLYNVPSYASTTVPQHHAK